MRGCGPLAALLLVACVEDTALVADDGAPDERPPDAAAPDVPSADARSPDAAVDGPDPDGPAPDVPALDLDRPDDAAVRDGPPPAPDAGPDVAPDASTCPVRLPVQTLTDSPAAKASPGVALSGGRRDAGLVWLEDGALFFGRLDGRQTRMAERASDPAIAWSGSDFLVTWNSPAGLRAATPGAEPRLVDAHAQQRGRLSSAHDALVVAADTPEGAARLSLAADGSLQDVTLAAPGLDAIEAAGPWLLAADPADGSVWLRAAEQEALVCEVGCDWPRAAVADDDGSPAVAWQALGRIHLREARDGVVADAPRGTDLDLVSASDRWGVAFVSPFDGPPGVYLKWADGERRLVARAERPRSPRIAVFASRDCVVFADDQIRWACLDYTECPP